MNHIDYISHSVTAFTGMGGFYRGIDANIMRAMVLNGTKMGVYDHCKGLITKSGYIPSGKNFFHLFCCFVPFWLCVLSVYIVGWKLLPYLKQFELFVLTLSSLFLNTLFSHFGKHVGMPTQFMAAFTAGFFMACTVSPFDMVCCLSYVLCYCVHFFAASAVP